MFSMKRRGLEPSFSICFAFIVGPIVSPMLFKKLQSVMTTVDIDKIALPHYLNGWLM
jgi:hypothetical protein